MAPFEHGLRFRLRVPMASWSETGANLRPTDFVPTWSAITGLIGAAFGWRRDDIRLVELASGYALAVRVEKPGERLEDYHTVQSPERSHSDRLRSRTRADELSVAQIHTTITRREYVTGADYSLLVVAAVESPVVEPGQIVDALRRPVFPLYAGRRSCPIGRIAAEPVSGAMDSVMPDATHWDARIPSSRTPSLIRERRDLRVGAMAYAARNECVA